MAKKLYYRIGEACKLLDIQPYVLRYWETEFPMLKPDKSTSGQRVYNDRDIRTIRRIKELLYDEGYTIAGAKKKLESEAATRPVGLGEEEAATEQAASAESAAAEPAPPKKKKKAKTRAKKGPKAAPSPDADEASEVERLKKGIEQALGQAREILDLLES